MNKKAVLTKDLFNLEDNPSYVKEFFARYEYPWQMLPDIKKLIAELLEKGIPGYTLLKEGVLVGENVSISPTATIIPPAIIGSGTEIRPGCFIRGNLICGRIVCSVIHLNLKMPFSYIMCKPHIITMLVTPS